MSQEEYWEASQNIGIYQVTLRSDQGPVVWEGVARNQHSAIRAACASQNAPESAVRHVEKV